jgi:hypothetical protein
MGKKRGDVRVQRTLCVDGNGEREKGFGEVGTRRRNGGTLVKGLLERGFAPSGEFEEIEMINGGEGEEIVQRWYHVGTTLLFSISARRLICRMKSGRP